MKEHELQENIKHMQQDLTKQKTISARYSMIRLFLIVCTVFTFYEGYQKASWFYVLMIVALILFFTFVRIHMRLKKEIALEEARVQCYQDIVARKQEGWKQFSDKGSDFLVEEATQAYDLDIFGNASLFQYLSVAKSISGREQLAHLLNAKSTPHTTIAKRQQAVMELSEQHAFNITMCALLKLFEQHSRKKKKQTIEDVYAYMERSEGRVPFIVTILATLLSLCTIVLTLLAIGSIIPAGYPLISALLSLIIATLSMLKNSSAFSGVQALDHMMSDYERLFMELESANFQSENLKECQTDCKDAAKAIHHLHRILNAVQMRNDGIMFLIMNALFLWDFQCVSALEHWRKQYGKRLRIWLRSLGEVEAYLSLSQLSYAKDVHCFPSYDDEHSSPHIAMKQIYHPLICEHTAIRNDFEVKAASYVITGSNMSGKTTFLRTIGLNMVLFHAGAALCGEAFSANSMDIYTSMRIRDDVSEGISTFYAEILRIKGMITESERKVPMLLLIDEIFKGTNSADRIICAKEVLRQLHLPWLITLVSTHDFELCELDFEQESAINYHFSEYYEVDEIRFDYALKEGRCTTTNAKELLRLAGIKGEF